MQTMLDLFKAAGYENYEEMEICKPYTPKKKIEVWSYRLGDISKNENPSVICKDRFEFKEVLNLFYKGKSKGYHVQFEGTEESFYCTGNHLFLVQVNYPQIPGVFVRAPEWKAAKELGASFMGVDSSGNWKKVYLTPTSEEFPVLDIEVKDNASYVSNTIVSHNSFGGTAKLFAEGLKKINPYISRFDSSLLLLNQVRDKIGGFAMPGMPKPEQTPGGHAVRFYASWRARVSKMEDIADKKEVIGNTIKIRNVKSKVGFPKRSAQLELYYATGFSPDQEYVDFIVKLGLVKQGGAWLSNDEWGMKVQGRDKLLDWLKANPDRFEECKKIVTASFTSNTVLDTMGEDSEDDDDYEEDEA